MSLHPGVRLGPYEVTALIGEGGMGKVWRARHTALKRDDALKVLPDALASDPTRLARLQRESQVLAPLNHPKHRTRLRARSRRVGRTCRRTGPGLRCGCRAGPAQRTRRTCDSARHGARRGTDAGGRDTRARPGSITTNAAVIRSRSSATTRTTASPTPLRASPGKRISTTPPVC